MATLDVLNQSGEKIRQIELSDEVFNAPVKEHLLWQMVVSQLAGRRRGTASTKDRSEVKGSTRKLFRQKGTGRARHGGSRANVFVGGGSVFGPKPRSYAMRLNKKVKRSALCSALSMRVYEQKVLVIEDLVLPEIKTKQVVALLKRLGVERGLIVDEKANFQLVKSVRNLPRSKYLAPEGLNVYDILRHETLVLSASAVKQIEERLLP
jgi:large subunit ribosomal protein L4